MNTPDHPCQLATWLQSERDRARAALLSEGMPPAQVAQLLQAAEEMHAGQLGWSRVTWLPLWGRRRQFTEEKHGRADADWRACCGAAVGRLSSSAAETLRE